MTDVYANGESPAVIAPRTLSALEQEVFARLGLAPGNWPALVVLPLVLASRAAPAGAGLFEPLRARPVQAPLWLHRCERVYRRALASLGPWPGESVLRADTGTFFSAALGAAGASGTPEALLAQGLALLAFAWAQSARVVAPYERCNRLLIWSLEEVAGEPEYVRSSLGQEFESLLLLIDAYLPTQEFELEPGAAVRAPPLPTWLPRELVGSFQAGGATHALAAPAQETAATSGWLALLVALRVDFERTHGRGSDAVAVVAERLRTESQRASAAPGLVLWRRGQQVVDWLARQAQGPDLDTVLAGISQFVAGQLATVPYPNRVQLLRVLGSMLAGTPATEGLPVESSVEVKDYLSRLRDEVVAYRLQGGKTSAKPWWQSARDSSRWADRQRVERTPVVVEPPPPAVPVSVAAPLTQLRWEAILAEARALTAERVERVVEARLLFDEHREECRALALVRDVAAVPSTVWVVGDLHGDLLVLAHAWRYIQEQATASGEKPHVIFLGDLVDRGPFSHETLLFLFGLLERFPGQIAVLPGNHDLEFHWDAAQRRFAAAVTPAEYVAELNALLEQDAARAEEHVRVARAAEHFFARCPRALFLPDGLLLAHGGFPHADLLAGLHTPADLGRGACLHDFVWLRAHPTARRKRPNRAARGCEYGYENFGEFCTAAHRLGIPVRALLRGHDHVAERYALFPAYRSHPIVTLNSMGRALDDEALPTRTPLACLARLQSGKLPVIYQLPIASDTVQAVYCAGANSREDGNPRTGGHPLAPCVARL